MQAVSPLSTTEKEFTYASFRLHENGLSPIGSPSLEEWQECGRFIRHAEASVHFWIGDWLRYGEVHFKEDYTQAIQLTGYNYHTLRVNFGIPRAHGHTLGAHCPLVCVEGSCSRASQKEG